MSFALTGPMTDLLLQAKGPARAVDSAVRAGGDATTPATELTTTIARVRAQVATQPAVSGVLDALDGVETALRAATSNASLERRSLGSQVSVAKAVRAAASAVSRLEEPTVASQRNAFLAAVLREAGDRAATLDSSHSTETRKIQAAVVLNLLNTTIEHAALGNLDELARRATEVRDDVAAIQTSLVGFGVARGLAQLKVRGLEELALEAAVASDSGPHMAAATELAADLRARAVRAATGGGEVQAVGSTAAAAERHARAAGLASVAAEHGRSFESNRGAVGERVRHATITDHLLADMLQQVDAGTPLSNQITSTRALVAQALEELDRVGVTRVNLDRPLSLLAGVADDTARATGAADHMATGRTHAETRRVAIVSSLA